MPFRAVPWLGSRAQQTALNRVQKHYLVEGLRAILTPVGPDELLVLVALQIPVLDVLTRPQLIDAMVHLRKYKGLIRRLPPPELQQVVAEARPDLYARISRNGGTEWLAAQLEDIRELSAR